MFFFFKQKTAYEMRISDWSSDVCSSDLPLSCFVVAGLFCRYQDCSAISAIMRLTSPEVTRGPPPPGLAPPTFSSGRVSTCVASARRAPTVDRSEEHTSELQSLMRSSYAVFCLKKTNRAE